MHETILLYAIQKGGAEKRDRCYLKMLDSILSIDIPDPGLRLVDYMLA